MVDVIVSGFSRMWLVPNRAAPQNAPEYQGLWKAGAVTWQQGDVTTIRVPDPSRYDEFIRIGKILGNPGDPQLPVMARYTSDLSRLLQLAKRGCDHDLQIHFGKCRDPQNFNQGWDKIAVLEAAHITQYGTSELGALQPSERSMVDENVPFTGENYYEIGRINFAEQATTQITQEIVDVLIPDTITCGACGITSDGCQVVLLLTLRAGGSPGTGADVAYTKNAGSTWAYREITTLTGSNDPDAFAVVSGNVVVVSVETIGLHYASLADLLVGAETWTSVTTGFVASHGPKAIHTADPTHTWMVGNTGYIYFTADPTAGVSVQDAGVATIQNLLDIHGVDQLNLVAVGAGNAVVKTNNGGSTWTAITGPAVGVALNSVWMKSPTEWLVGTDGGKLYYTTDSGVTWTEVAFPGSGAGSVSDIVYATGSVGYMAHATATPRGRILRTVDGGHSWYVAPESGTAMAANDRVNALATCDPNVVWGGGLADNGTDGFAVKGA